MRGLAAALIVAGAILACSNIPEAESTSCLGTGCGPHGTCSVEGATPVCVCEVGYDGPACAACAPGFQDTDGNGFCARACAATPCGPHERCSEASGRPLCVCVVGYSQPEGGGACVFTGGPVDPSFDKPQPGGWTTRGAVTIDTGRPSDAGIGRGWARFGGFGDVVQSFEMPSYADAEPLALELELGCTRTGTCENVHTFFGVDFGAQLVEHALFLPRPSHAPTITRVCLGERAFGRKVDFRLRAYGGSAGADSSGDGLIGRAQFVPFATCAAPGTVKNGDFQAGDWEVEQGAGVDFIEEGGTRLGRLAPQCGFEPTAAMSTTMSIPEALERPALAFSLQGTRDAFSTVSVGFVGTWQVRGTGAKEDVVVCLPPSTRGQAFRLEVRGTGTRCFDTPNNVVHVDDFVLRSEPSCAEVDEGMRDGDFEGVGLVSPWWTSSENVTLVRDPAAAHSGSGYLRLAQSCAGALGATWSSTSKVPSRPPGAAGGPALKLWYRLSPEAVASVTASGGAHAERSYRLPAAPTWTEATLCLPAYAWGFRYGVVAQLWRGPDDSDDCVPSVFDVDDVSFAADPSCPIE
ncbi:MAG: hypothetical protein KF764_04585 [Labilithrix sp.]|nr:hypothetical protein [Labilithrix sp.]MBX3223172.1 hypothetical protein [Labilithrix sp.]